MATGTIKRTSKERLVLSIAAKQYATYGEAMEALWTAYSALSTDDKRNSYIQSRNNISHVEQLTHGLYKFSWFNTGSNANLEITLFDLSLKAAYQYLVGIQGTTFTDLTASAQQYAIKLYVRAY